jgi:hypothetical protein
MFDGFLFRTSTFLVLKSMPNVLNELSFRKEKNCFVKPIDLLVFQIYVYILTNSDIPY